MRISVQAFIESDGNEPTKPLILGVIERAADADPASGLGLFLSETQELLRQLQSVVLTHQVDQFVAEAARCRGCGESLGIKDNRTMVYRTTFGKATLRNPRFYACCGSCGRQATNRATFSPLSSRLRDRVHPQWAWLQCRYASGGCKLEPDFFPATERVSQAPVHDLTGDRRCGRPVLGSGTSPLRYSVRPETAADTPKALVTAIHQRPMCKRPPTESAPSQHFKRAGTKSSGQVAVATRS